MRRYTLIALVTCALLGGAFAAGRYSAPTKVVVEERLRVQTVEKQVVVTQEKVRVEVIRVADERRNILRNEKTIKLPDGTTVTERQERDLTTVKETEKSDSQTDKKVDIRQEKKLEVTASSKKVTESQKPQWSLGVTADVPLALDIRKPVLRVEASRRLVGPVWGTIGVQPTNRMVGVGLRIDF